MRRRGFKRRRRDEAQGRGKGEGKSSREVTPKKKKSKAVNSLLANFNPKKVKGLEGKKRRQRRRLPLNPRTSLSLPLKGSRNSFLMPGGGSQEKRENEKRSEKKS